MLMNYYYRLFVGVFCIGLIEEKTPYLSTPLCRGTKDDDKGVCKLQTDRQIL